MTLMEFDSAFPDEAACYEHLYKTRYKDCFVCPRCRVKHTPFRIKARNKLQCKKRCKKRCKKHCKKQVSMLVGTVMEASKLPLLKWFYAFWLVANDKRGSSATYLSRRLGIRYHNAWYPLKRIQAAMMKTREGRYLLRGTVGVDEAFVGGASCDTKPGRGTGKTEVMTGVEVGAVVNKKGRTCLNRQHRED